MKIEEIVGTALGVTAGICIIALAVINGENISNVKVLKRYPRTSSVSVGETYTNLDNTIRAKVNKIYYRRSKDNIILYSKYSARTGNYIETCSMPEGRFLSIYY